MLVEVLAGPHEAAARSSGNFYFTRSPVAGEEIEIEGKLITVRRAWHRPDVHFAGAKFAILVDAWDDESRAGAIAYDDAGSII
jgi:hypothetical protein